MKNYECKVCGTVIQSSTTPHGRCEQSNSKNHQWQELGEVGEINYQCKTCGLLIKSNKTPHGYCEQSNSKNHQWQKL